MEKTLESIDEALQETEEILESLNNYVGKWNPFQEQITRLEIAYNELFELRTELEKIGRLI